MQWPVTTINCDAFQRGLNESITQSLTILLNLYLRCLQWSGLPFFVLPEIVLIDCIDPKQKKYKLGLRINTINYLNPIIDEIAFQKALKIMYWIGKYPPSLISRQKLHHFIQASVIPSLATYIPAGHSTVPVLRVAHELGIPFLHLGLGVYQLGWGSRAKRLMYSASQSDSALGLRLSRNKVATAQLLKQYGLPAPQQSLVNSRDELVQAMASLNYPLVSKPIDGARGEGVTVDITCLEELQTAYDLASEVGKSTQILLEKQVEGICHRIFISAGKMLYAVMRGPIAIVGDGKRTIAKLIESEQSKQSELPFGISMKIPDLDSLTLKELIRQGLKTQDIPSLGQVVNLRRIESTEWGGMDTDVTELIHPANVHISILAAQALGLDMAGVDVISTDISKPWYETGAVINEVNFSPLLGGAEISRSYLQKFFKQFILKDGKIPIETYDSISQAQIRYEQLLSKGLRVYLVLSNQVLGPDRQKCHSTHKETLKQAEALLYRLDVDVIVIATL